MKFLWQTCWAHWLTSTLVYRYAGFGCQTATHIQHYTLHSSWLYLKFMYRKNKSNWAHFLRLFIIAYAVGPRVEALNWPILTQNYYNWLDLMTLLKLKSELIMEIRTSKEAIEKTNWLFISKDFLNFNSWECHQARGECHQLKKIWNHICKLKK